MPGHPLARSLLFAAVSVVVIALALRYASAPVTIAPRHASATPLDLLDPAAVQAVSGTAIDTTELLARPVFSRSRRPVSAPAAAPAPANAPQPMQFTLAGVLINDSDRRALIVSPAAPNGTWLNVGDKIGGWTLDKVEPNSVEMASATDRVTLQLYVDNAGAN